MQSNDTEHLLQNSDNKMDEILKMHWSKQPKAFADSEVGTWENFVKFPIESRYAILDYMKKNGKKIPASFALCVLPKLRNDAISELDEDEKSKINKNDIFKNKNDIFKNKNDIFECGNEEQLIFLYNSMKNTGFAEQVNKFSFVEQNEYNKFNKDVQIHALPFFNKDIIEIILPKLKVDSQVLAYKSLPSSFQTNNLKKKLPPSVQVVINNAHKPVNKKGLGFGICSMILGIAAIIAGIFLFPTPFGIPLITVGSALLFASTIATGINGNSLRKMRHYEKEIILYEEQKEENSQITTEQKQKEENLQIIPGQEEEQEQEQEY